MFDLGCYCREKLDAGPSLGLKGSSLTNLVHSDGFGTLFPTSLSVISVLLGLVVETVVFTLNNEPIGK